jgi:hypothetical protein
MLTGPENGLLYRDTQHITFYYINRLVELVEYSTKFSKISHYSNNCIRVSQIEP